MDGRSGMTVAQEGIEKFYDGLRGLRIVLWLGDRYDCADVCATFLRMHSLPTIALSVGSHQVDGLCFCMATFVDNLLTIAETQENELLTCRAYPYTINVPPDWMRSKVLKCLDHHIDDNGGRRSCFLKFTAAMIQFFTPS
ncbi:unnamed protein product [Prorocentrum cordatum]|uniref:Uncharacterized protein n=1 Tax=Prorocentrum cordatum TaxID=2364126 RepID=A0ABN9PIU2_9DINO|nr:unnamed protein product [Polarella glacialis]